MAKKNRTAQQKLSDRALQEWVQALPMDEIDSVIVRGSGNQDHAPGDAEITVGDMKYLVEHKATEKGSRSVSVKEWVKILNESREQVGRLPILGVTFVHPKYGTIEHLAIMRVCDLPFPEAGG